MNKSLITIMTIIALTLASSFVRAEQAIVCSEQQALFCDDFENGLNPLWTQIGDCTWNVIDGQVSAAVTGGGLGCSMSVLGTTWTDYTFEYDVRGNSGVDKGVGFRYDGNQAYGFAIRSDWITGDEAFLHVPGHNYAQIVNFPSQNGVWYHVEITIRGNHIVIKVDGTKIIDYVDLSNSCPSGGIAVGCYPGGAGVCDVSFDNVVVKAIYSGPIWHIQPNGDDVLGNGSVTNPFASIQKGIDAAVSGDTVLVGPGTYTQALDYIGKAIVVKSGFGPDSVIFTSPTPIATLVSFHSGEDTLSVLDGFTFKNIVTSGSNIGTGLVSLQGSSGTIRNCRFIDNSSIISADIMSFVIHHIQGGFAIVEDNVFLSNEGRGGPVYVAAAQGRIRNNVFSDNTATNMGGAINVAGIYGNSTYLIEGNLFVRNNAQNGLWTSSPGGGAIFLSENVNTIVRNNTFVNNTDESGGGGAIGVWYYCSGIAIEKNIFVGNNGYAIASNHGSQVSLTCNDAIANLPANYAGSLYPDANSFSLDPLFCDTASGDYYIKSSSPCAPANNNCGALIGVYAIGCLNAAPSPFDLISPLNTLILPIGTRTPTLEWTAAIDIDPLDAVSYSVHLALYSNFTFVSVIPGISNNHYTPPIPLAWGESYWWKVLALDLNGGETWSSQVFRFRTMTLGDANGDGLVSVVDVVYLVNYIFVGGPPPNPLESGDPNCDERFNIVDIVFLVNYIFAGGAPPCEG